MISHERECIFIHIPKTAGTSIENAIWGPDESVRTKEQLWIGFVRPGFNKYQSDGLQHLLSTQVRQEVGGEIFQSYFKFTFVRNPWDKAVSQYSDMQRQRPKLRQLMDVPESLSFEEYLLMIQQKSHVQWYEQWRFILDDEGHRLVDFVGRFESIEDDFRTVARRIGLDEAALPHARRSPRRNDYRSYYTPQTADMVARIYARDIELLGYTFDG